MTLLGDPESGRGMRLLGRTLLRYRRESTLAILSALLWMVLVVVGPYLEKLVIDRAILPDQPSLLLPLVGLLLLVGLLKAVGIGGRRLFAFILSYRAETDLRNRLFEHVQRLAFSFHDRVATGELMARSSTDLSQVRLVFAMLPITVANIALVVATVVVLILLDPLLGVVASLAIPVLFLLAARYARRVTRLSFDVQQRLADLASVVEEGISGIRVVKAFGAEAETVRRVDRATDGIFRRSMEMLRIRSANMPVFELIPAAGTLAVLWLGGYLVIEGRITLGDFVAFTQYLVLLVFPLRMTAWFFAELPRGSAAAARVLQLLGTAPDVTDPEKPQPLPEGNGDIRFAEVSFSYPEGPPVLTKLDLHIPAGTSIAVVGGAGSGKTTLAYLIPRFYDVTSGATLIDGVDVRQLRLDELRREVAVVFEDPFLFSSTIRENIAFGAPDATDEQVRLAARLARAHEFIVALPDGYDTVVGERGYTLSGGQRQRVALARAVLRDPRVLILDDATSSVDAVTEREIREALQEVMAGRTTLIIAHRTSTLALADRVALVDEGRVVAVGSHRELLENVPRYAAVLAATLEEESGVAS
jgi:ATP-binding cassette, subfamily B, bacterial